MWLIPRHYIFFLLFITCLSQAKLTVLKNPVITASWNWENSRTECLIHMLTVSLCCKCSNSESVADRYSSCLSDFRCIALCINVRISAHCFLLTSIRAPKAVDSISLKHCEMLSDYNLFCDLSCFFSNALRDAWMAVAACKVGQMAGLKHLNKWQTNCRETICIRSWFPEGEPHRFKRSLDLSSSAAIGFTFFASTIIRPIAMKFGPNIHGSFRMDCDNIGNPFSAIIRSKNVSST